MDTANYINHVVLVLDESSSMTGHRTTLPKIADNEIAYLAQRSKELDQETRVTVYVFSSGSNAVRCLIYDKDVLRLPSIQGLYKPNGMTALIDATLKGISDLEQTATLYGEHAFLMYVLTDGQENASRNNSTALSSKLHQLYSREDWTVAVFVPDQRGVFEAKKHGFLPENISIWNPNSTAGLEEVGQTIRKATDTFMTGRSSGIRSYKSLFSLNTLSTRDITVNLTPVPASRYRMLYVPFDQRVDDFVRAVTGKPLIIGTAYYQLNKKETIQPQKSIAISYQNKVYSGPQARQMLGLPDHSVEVRPDSHPGYTIFVQSTAPNRKLISGSNLLLMN